MYRVLVTSSRNFFSKSPILHANKRTVHILLTPTEGQPMVFLSKPFQLTNPQKFYYNLSQVACQK